jgi:hypothetical protein
MVSHALGSIQEEGLVKLAASLFCVAALSMVGCAGVDTVGGGQGDGIHPSKADVQNPEEPKPFDGRQVTNLKLKTAAAPADAVCDGCVMDTYRAVDNSAGIDEVRVVSDGGLELCRLYLDHDQVVLDECGLLSP